MQWSGLLTKKKVAILCHFKNAVCAHGLLWVSEPRALAAPGGAPGWHPPAPLCVSQGRLLFLTPSDQSGKGPHESLPPSHPAHHHHHPASSRGAGAAPTQDNGTLFCQMNITVPLKSLSLYPSFLTF